MRTPVQLSVAEAFPARSPREAKDNPSVQVSTNTHARVLTNARAPGFKTWGNYVQGKSVTGMAAGIVTGLGS
jgi:hypothetical protein